MLGDDDIYNVIYDDACNNVVVCGVCVCKKTTKRKKSPAATVRTSYMLQYS